MAGRTRWESFGNTRRPKTVSTPESAAAPGGSLETARVVATSTSGNLAPDLDSATEGRNGYATENQKFLHVQVESGNSKSVQIYGYNYAFRVWAPVNVLDTGGATQTLTATTGGAGQAQLYIFNIDGIDRVAFVSASPPGSVKAACNTLK